MNVALSDVLVELHSPDFKATKDFYQTLGFQVVWEEPPKGMNGYLVMRRNNSVLCFFCGNEEVYNHPYFKKFPKTTVRGYGVKVGIPTENIEHLYNTVLEKLGKKHIAEELKLKPWGLKDFRIVDPFGYYLRFTSQIIC